jgi:hypothetical protein
MPNQLVIKEAGVPGAADSYYSRQQSLTVVSPRTLVPEVGWLMVTAVSGVSYQLMTVDASPPTFVTVLAANVNGTIWSDGANLYAAGASGTARYFVLAHKP